MAYNRDTSKDISLGTGEWKAGASDGTTLWFCNEDSPRTAKAWSVSSRTTDSTKDIALDIGGPVSGAASDGTRLWFSEDSADRSHNAICYTASTRVRDNRFNASITFGTDTINSLLVVGSTLWLIRDDAGSDTDISLIRGSAYDIGSSSLSRNSRKDFHINATRVGRISALSQNNFQASVSDGTTVWFVYHDSFYRLGNSIAVAYTASSVSAENTTPVRDADNDINFGSRNFFRGATYANNTLWFVDDTTNTAVAYTEAPPPPKQIKIGTTDYSRVFIGGTEYNRIYLGSELIWEG